MTSYGVYGRYMTYIFFSDFTFKSFNVTIYVKVVFVYTFSIKIYEYGDVSEM